MDHASPVYTHTSGNSGVAVHWRWKDALAAQMTFALLLQTGVYPSDDFWPALSSKSGLGEHLATLHAVCVKNGAAFSLNPTTVVLGVLEVQVAMGNGSAERPFVVEPTINPTRLAQLGRERLQTCRANATALTPLAWFARSAGSRVVLDPRLAVGCPNDLFLPDGAIGCTTTAANILSATLMRLHDNPQLHEQPGEISTAGVRQLARAVLLNARGGSFQNLECLEELPFVTVRIGRDSPEPQLWVTIAGVGEIQLIGEETPAS